MLIKHLSLTNFRNYGRMELKLMPGITVLHGPNAQGKTNLLESIYYMATTRSPFATQDDQLIHWEAGLPEEPVVVGRIVLHLADAAGPRHLEMRLIRETVRGQSSFRREALVDRRKVRLMDLLGNLRVVLFLPQDVGLITGTPADRRRYLDITLCQTDRDYCQTLATYNKVLEQRNALLRTLSERRPQSHDLDLLSIYTDKLVAAGSRVFTRRAAFMAEIGHLVQRIHYEELTGREETVQLHYLPRLQVDGLQRSGDNWEALQAHAAWLDAQRGDSAAVAARFQEVLSAAQAREFARGRTVIGPHRDDWRFLVNGRSLDMFGSRGQQRTAILALKLAEIQWIAAETGDTPILLLDDVLAELDGARRELVQSYIAQAPQALLTTTQTAIFAPEFLESATVLRVRKGRISAESTPTTP